MAEQVIINKSVLTEIGNAIREKKGTTALIPTTEMASEIASIETGGGVKFQNIGDPNIVFSIKNNANTDYPIKLMSVNYDTSVSAFSISKVAASTTTFNFQPVNCPYLDTGIKIAGLINNVFVFGHGTVGTDKKIVGTFHIIYINQTSGELSEETYDINYSATFEYSIQFKFPYKSDKAIICMYFESTE